MSAPTNPRAARAAAENLKISNLWNSYHEASSEVRVSQCILIRAPIRISKELTLNFFLGPQRSLNALPRISRAIRGNQYWVRPLAMFNSGNE